MSDEVVDTQARQGLSTHEEICGIRYQNLERQFERVAESLGEMKQDHKALNVKVDGFQRLVFVSVIGFFVSLAIAFGISMWNSQDRFTGGQALLLQQEIQQLKEQGRGTKP